MLPDTHICGTFITKCPLPANYFILFHSILSLFLFYFSLPTFTHLTFIFHVVYFLYLYLFYWAYFILLSFLFLFCFYPPFTSLFPYRPSLNKTTVDNRHPPDIQHGTKRFPSSPHHVRGQLLKHSQLMMSTQPLRRTGVNLSSPYYWQQLQCHNTSQLPPQAYDTPMIPPAIMVNITKS